MGKTHHPRTIGRSVGAVFGGVAAGSILSFGSDVGLHAIGAFPPIGLWTAPDFLVGTAYRGVYMMVGCYFAAWLAPNRPMRHALFGGGVALVLSLVGALTTWDNGLGPHWYPLALAALAMPCAWVGGRLHTVRTTRVVA